MITRLIAVFLLFGSPYIFAQTNIWFRNGDDYCQFDPTEPNRIAWCTAHGFAPSAPPPWYIDKDPPDLFRNARAFVIGIWPCNLESPLVRQNGSIADLDVLGLKPWDPQDLDLKWFDRPASWPFEFLPEAAGVLKKSLKDCNAINGESFHSDSDSEGQYFSFCFLKFPEIEIRRYPSFIALVLDRTETHFADRNEYNASIDKLLQCLGSSVFSSPSVMKSLAVLPRAGLFGFPVRSGNYDSFPVITHLWNAPAGSSRCASDYVFPMPANMLVPQHWTDDQFSRMGLSTPVLSDHEGFFASRHDSVADIRMLVFDEPLYKHKVKSWQGLYQQTFGDRAVSRYVRFFLLTKTTLPYFISEATAANQMLEQSQPIQQFCSYDELQQWSDQQSETIRQEKKLLFEVRASRNKVHETCRVLDDCLNAWDQTSGQNLQGQTTAERAFQKQYGITLVNLWLLPQFIRDVLRYDAPKNAAVVMSGRSGFLVAQEHRLDELTVHLEDTIRRREDGDNRTLTLQTAIVAIKTNNRWMIWTIAVSVVIAILGVICAVLIAVFQEDLKNRRDKLFTWALACWQAVKRHYDN